MIRFREREEPMSIYGVTGVRLNTKGAIEWVQLCQIDPKENRWIGPSRDIAAHDAADMVLAGDRLISIFIIKGHGGKVHGADFLYVTDEYGRESIQLESESEGKTLADLVMSGK